MKFLKDLFNFTKAEPKESLKGDKDPLDFTLTNLSTPWRIDRCCLRCNNYVTHEERMSNICNACGYESRPSGLLSNYRRYRKIFNGGRWCYQVLNKGVNGNGKIIPVEDINFEFENQ